ncbi:MAG: hypothetical protein Q4D51_10855 [Eubacteriales bacterium]|nr:hypothetical protein [Eubacteriales bacterium]
MIYKIIRIEEADYGCEERPADYVPMVRVCLRATESDENGEYEERIVEMEDAIMYQRGLDEGSDAVIGMDGALYEPGKDDIVVEDDSELEERSRNQNAFMENYFDALEELEEEKR